MAGIDEVARAAGVSTATVSRALSGRGAVSEPTRVRVEAVAKSLGYVVSAAASSLASGRTRSIGVLVPFVNSWFFSTVLSGTATALQGHGYDVTLYTLTSERGQRREILETFLRRRRIDGVIAISVELADDETDLLLELDLPVISIGGPTARLTTLVVDEAAVARLATEHLISLGHRRIAHIGASRDFDVSVHPPTLRRRGFERALADAGIPSHPELFQHADFTIEGGSRAAQALLDRPGERPTAIFAASDEMAIGAMLAARALGLRVPGDVSIVGVDGNELGEFFQLTTIDQFPLRQGERAAETILAALEPVASAEGSPPMPRPDAAAGLPFELVVRASTAPPAA